MDNTRQSLLILAQGGDETAWVRFADLYRPLIVGWLRQHALQPHDVEDLAQEVLLAVVRNLPHFCHNGKPGAFRRWLRTITVNRTKDFWKSRAARTVAVGDSHAFDVLQQLEADDSELSRQWDEEHDRYVLRCLLDLMELKFEPSTVQAFRRLVLDGASAEEVARELNTSVGAVYVAKSRVMRSIREEAAGLID